MRRAILIMLAIVFIASVALASTVEYQIKNPVSVKAKPDQAKSREDIMLFQDDFESGLINWYQANPSGNQELFWHTIEDPTAPSPPHCATMQNDAGSYDPLMDNFLIMNDMVTIPVEALGANGDFMIRGYFEDETGAFPDVDYFGVECSPGIIQEATWHVENGYWTMEGYTAQGNYGYDSQWYQVLDTPEIDLSNATQLQLRFRLSYNVEAPGGEPIGYDGWDGCNVRISTDGGATWEVLTSDNHPYQKTSLYSFGYQHLEGQGIPGWVASSNGWVDTVTVNLNDYTDEFVKIRFAFASDPAYDTDDDPALFGMRVDDIEVSCHTGLLFSNYGEPDDMTATSIGEAWYAISNPTGQPGVPNYVYTNVPENWESFVEAYGQPINMSDYIGEDIKFRIYFHSDEDTPIGEGMFIDNFEFWYEGLSPYQFYGTVAIEGGIDPTGTNITFVNLTTGDIYYHTVDNSAGEYVIENVNVGSYYGTAGYDNRLYWDTWEGSVVDTSVNVDYYLEEQTGSDVEVHYDGPNYTGIGTGADAMFETAARFTPDELGDYVGCPITKVRIWICQVPNAEIHIKIWEGGEPGNPGNLVYEYELDSYNVDDWTEHILFTPVRIKPGNEYWVGYWIHTPTGYPAGVDAGPMVPDKGGWINLSPYGWVPLTDINPVLDYNWNIRATILHAAAQDTQYIPLYEQWNWISTYIHPVDTSISAVFASLTPPISDPPKIYQVKNQTQSATYIYPPGVWIGDLTNISDGEGYLVKMLEQAPDFSITGTQIPYNTPIELNVNWNWIAYFPTYPLTVVAEPNGYALQSIEPNAYQIKNQTQSATYYVGIGWIGDLAEMEPGVGYKLKMDVADTLVYPSPPSTKK